MVWHGANANFVSLIEIVRDIDLDELPADLNDAT